MLKRAVVDKSVELLWHDVDALFKNSDDTARYNSGS